MTTLSVWKAVLGSYYSDSSIPKDLNKNEDAIEDEMEPITDEERRDSLCESSDASVESQSTRAKPELDKDSTGVTSRAIDLLYPQRTVNVKDASTQGTILKHTR
ncbi:hypothetical protein BJV82DRAFT_22235 [Fennellomyces sp. T-0311]|nr:hypothetical protein BJV82DRAFT_22235 [Fennellomyces sp. T-0311]